jgi:hypothetical protein
LRVTVPSAILLTSTLLRVTVGVAGFICPFGPNV